MSAQFPSRERTVDRLIPIVSGIAHENLRVSKLLARLWKSVRPRESTPITLWPGNNKAWQSPLRAGPGRLTPPINWGANRPRPAATCHLRAARRLGNSFDVVAGGLRQATGLRGGLKRPLATSFVLTVAVGCVAAGRGRFAPQLWGSVNRPGPRAEAIARPCCSRPQGDRG